MANPKLIAAIRHDRANGVYSTESVRFYARRGGYRSLRFKLNSAAFHGRVGQC